MDKNTGKSYREEKRPFKFRKKGELDIYGNVIDWDTTDPGFIIPPTEEQMNYDYVAEKKKNDEKNKISN